MSALEEMTKDLPSNRGEALLVFVDRIYLGLNNSATRWTPNDLVTFVTFLRRFSSKYSLAKLPNYQSEHYPNEAQHLTAYVDYLRKHRAEILSVSSEKRIDELISEYEMKTDAESFGIARLNSEEKKKIHEHISRIREILETSDLSERKKNKLFERLNNLAQEVDTQGTLTDRFFAFAGDVAFVLGDMTTKAKPLTDEVKEMLRIVARSRARQEGISLPPGDEVLRLPSPGTPDKAAE